MFLILVRLTALNTLRLLDSVRISWTTPASSDDFIGLRRISKCLMDRAQLKVIANFVFYRAGFRCCVLLLLSVRVIVYFIVYGAEVGLF